MQDLLSSLRRFSTVNILLMSVAILAILLIVTQHLAVLLAMIPYATLLLAHFTIPASPTTITLEAKPDEKMMTGEFAIMPNLVTVQNSVTVDGLVRASQAINEVTLMQSENAKEQADLIQNANQMLDDFLQLTEQITDKSRHVNRVANQSVEMSDGGSTAIHDTIESMDGIRTQVEEIGKTITRLADLTRKIDDIINSVSEIATQSNLLALNASIEAARAGVHGRGFAVVADEVRALAGQSTQSAEQVRAILREIQGVIREAIKATQEGVHDVEEGLTRTQTAQSAMMQISTTVNDSRRAIADITSVLQKQAQGMEEIAISMDRIQRITQSNLDSTKTVETVSSNLTRLANDLVTQTS
jgi:methyl-accepting chemotaxis protein